MKTYSNFRSAVSNLLILFTITSLLLVGCGDSGGTETNPDPDPDPTPTPTGQSFDSGNISPGGSFSFTFDDEEAIDYICSIHPDMEGSITIESGAGSDQDTVIIADFEFTPANITIAPGTEVTWINEDEVAHTSTSQ